MHTYMPTYTYIYIYIYLFIFIHIYIYMRRETFRIMCLVFFVLILAYTLLWQGPLGFI